MRLILLLALLTSSALPARAEPSNQSTSARLDFIAKSVVICVSERDPNSKLACFAPVLASAIDLEVTQSARVLTVIHARSGVDLSSTMTKLLKAHGDYVRARCAVRAMEAATDREGSTDGAVCMIEDYLFATALLTLAESGRVMSFPILRKSEVVPTIRTELEAAEQNLDRCVKQPDAPADCAAASLTEVNKMLDGARGYRRRIVAKPPHTPESATAFEASIPAWDTYANTLCGVTGAAGNDVATRTKIRTTCAANLNLVWIRKAYQLSAEQVGRRI